MAECRLPPIHETGDGRFASFDVTPMVRDLTQQVVKRVDEGAAAEVVAFLAAGGYLAAHDAALREQVSREILAGIVRADDGSLNPFAMGEYHAARIARGGAS